MQEKKSTIDYFYDCCGHSRHKVVPAHRLQKPKSRKAMAIAYLFYNICFIGICNSEKL